MTEISRRGVLKAAGIGAGAALTPAVGAKAVTTPRAKPHHTPTSMKDIEHVVILMQENRSFDNYFGTLRGVRGFSDPTARAQINGQSVFHQPDPDLLQNPSRKPYLLPWRLNTKVSSGQQVADLSHAWLAQLGSWNGGKMNGFVLSHRVGDSAPPDQIGTDGAFTMGYYTREDIPWQYALADAYTICDNYHCSVFGPTNPNRIMLMSATVNPEGDKGGPCVDNGQSIGQLQWESYPERLQRAGIDWKIYQEHDNYGDNMLPFFAGVVKDLKSDLYRRSNSFIPTPKGAKAGPALIKQLRHDVVTGNLPQVSWIVGSAENSEHPENTPAYGADFVDGCIKALQADPKVWAKTVLFVNYDENDGFFDHVKPPTPPQGTPGEYVSLATALQHAEVTTGLAGPVGLGFRVPMIVVSPFSRGGLCSSDVYDHTSTLLFLERRFGVEVPNLSDWRRSTVGDLTNALDFARGRNMTIPKLPDTKALVRAADQQAKLPDPAPPATQQMPSQEPGPARRRPSGIVHVPHK